MTLFVVANIDGVLKGLDSTQYGYAAGDEMHMNYYFAVRACHTNHFMPNIDIMRTNLLQEDEESLSVCPRLPWLVDQSGVERASVVSKVLGYLGSM